MTTTAATRFRPGGTWAILVGTAVMLSLSMGLRQSLGLFVQPAARDLSLAISDFTLAIAAQNLIWGLLQPITGAIAAIYGFRRVMVAGAVIYSAGLLILQQAQGMAGIMLGAGVCLGIALACTASGAALAVASRAVTARARSSVLGAVSAAGSVGALVAAPIGQQLIGTLGWRAGVLGFLLLSLIMLPMAFMAGRADRIPVAAPAAGDGSARDALRLAMHNGPFLVMSGAYFVCGLQLVFITTHLPSYLALCGLDPMLAASALATIGGFNVLGSLFFGWAGGRWSKGVLLGGIYVTRSLALSLYFAIPPTPAATLLFAAVMGFLWLGVAPLVAGAVAETFGLRWQAMIQGVAFMSHQFGSFVGAYGGGALFDWAGNYDTAWRLGVGMGLAAGIVQIVAALPRRPTSRPTSGPTSRPAPA